MLVYVFNFCLSSLECEVWHVQNLVAKLVPSPYKVLNKCCSVLLNSFSCLDYWQMRREWSPVPLSLPERHLPSRVKRPQLSSLLKHLLIVSVKTDCSCVVTFCPQQFHPLGPGVGFPHLGAWRARVSLLSHCPDHVQWCSQCRRWKPPLFRSQKGWPACPAPAVRLEIHAVLVRTAHRTVTLHPELA